MGTKNQNQDLTATWTIDTSNDTYTLGKNASIITDENAAIVVEAGANNNKLVLKGDAEATDAQYVVNILGNGTHLVIAKTSNINGADANVGVMATGVNFSMVNSGAISGVSFGLGVSDYADVVNKGSITSQQVGIGGNEGLNLANSGKIDGDVYGILSEADGVVIHNLLGGKILSDTTAIGLYGEGTAEITNAGLIKGIIAISDGEADTTIVNKGTIKGNVNLGAGEDVFNTLNGKFEGIVNGGDGNDTYIINDKDTQIAEQPAFGYDKVRSMTSYTLGDNLEDLILLGDKDTNANGNDGSNVLTGNKGDNVLRGFDGSDYLKGGKGNDILIGGDQGDMFDFRKGTGHDVVKDFVNGEDVIFTPFANNGPDIANLIENHAVEKNGGVLISYGDDSIFLKGMTMNQLDETDFFSGL
ncbi:calcium-binding protein [Rhizobium sp.]